MTDRPKKLLEVVSDTTRRKHYSDRTAKREFHMDTELIYSTRSPYLFNSRADRDRFLILSPSDSEIFEFGITSSIPISQLKAQYSQLTDSSKVLYSITVFTTLE